jgi:hypothetical protein
MQRREDHNASGAHPATTLCAEQTQRQNESASQGAANETQVTALNQSRRGTTDGCFHHCRALNRVDHAQRPWRE